MKYIDSEFVGVGEREPRQNRSFAKDFINRRYDLRSYHDLYVIWPLESNGKKFLSSNWSLATF